DAPDQFARGSGTDINNNDLAVAVRRHVCSVVTFHDNGKRKCAADSTRDTFVVDKERAQVVFVPYCPGSRIDDAERVVVVIGNHKSVAIRRYAETTGIGANADTDSFVAMPQGDLPVQPPRRAGLTILVDDVVSASSSIELAAVGREDETDVRVGL